MKLERTLNLRSHCKQISPLGILPSINLTTLKLWIFGQHVKQKLKPQNLQNILSLSFLNLTSQKLQLSDLGFYSFGLVSLNISS